MPKFFPKLDSEIDILTRHNTFWKTIYVYNIIEVLVSNLNNIKHFGES